MIQSSFSPPAAEPTADLEAGLSRLGVSCQAIVDSVDGAVGLGPGCVLLSVGSVAEGLGTNKSDVDLLLIRLDGPGTDTRTAESSWMVGGRIVDLKTVRSADVEGLILRLREWAGLPWNVTRAAGFSLDDRLLLHRLLRGCQLFPARRGKPDDPYRPPESQLARLKLQVARHLARTIQVDMVGYRDSGDYASLVFAAQELLGHAVDGLLAGHHLTNPTPKWRSRLLGSLPADWSRSIATRPTRLPADRLYWELHRAPAEPERRAALTHASLCATFARAMFAWAEPALVRGSAIAPTPFTWGHEDHPPRGRRLPPLEIDVDFRIADGRATLARLNEFGSTLQVSEREFAVLLLCDGQTTVSQAAAVVGGPPHSGSDDPDIGRLVEMAAKAGLWREQPGD